MRVPRSTGLPMPPPIRHQPRTITVTVQALPGGQLRVSTPHARGWAAVARSPHQLARAIANAFTETSVAGYAAWRKQRYDLDKLTAADDPTEPHQQALTGGGRSTQGGGYRTAAVSYSRGATVRPDQAHPAAWSPNEDGSWCSPAGRRFTHPATIAKVVERRAAMGLPIAAPAREAS